LAGVDLEVEEDEILAIIGPNGSGKTTLFNCISSVYKADEGDLHFKGESLIGLSPDSVAHRGIARTFQNLRLFLHMTVLDNLLLGRHIRFRKNPLSAVLRLRGEELRHRETVEEIIEFLESPGLQAGARVGLPLRCSKARGTGKSPCHGTRVAPFGRAHCRAHLGREGGNSLSDHGIRGRYKTAILLVEHDLRIASKLADRMVALDYGLKIAREARKRSSAHPRSSRPIWEKNEPFAQNHQH